MSEEEKIALWSFNDNKDAPANHYIPSPPHVIFYQPFLQQFTNSFQIIHTKTTLIKAAI